MNKLSEEYLYTIALNRKLKPVDFLKFRMEHQIVVYAIKRNF